MGLNIRILHFYCKNIELKLEFTVNFTDFKLSNNFKYAKNAD